MSLLPIFQLVVAAILFCLFVASIVKKNETRMRAAFFCGSAAFWLGSMAFSLARLSDGLRGTSGDDPSRAVSSISQGLAGAFQGSMGALLLVAISAVTLLLPQKKS